MYVSAKKHWILEMIKGPDLVPAKDRPGMYSLRGEMTVALFTREIYYLGPGEVLDLSDPVVLAVRSGSHAFEIPWSDIERMEYAERLGEAQAIRKPELFPSRHGLIAHPLVKKTG